MSLLLFAEAGHWAGPLLRGRQLPRCYCSTGGKRHKVNRHKVSLLGETKTRAVVFLAGVWWRQSPSKDPLDNLALSPLFDMSTQTKKMVWRGTQLYRCRRT